MKMKIVALMGKSGSGKDTILKEIVSCHPKEFYRIINHTTRPMRQGETNGADYFFVSNDEFVSLQDEMILTSKFNDWNYGTCLTNLKQGYINIGVFSPRDIITLQKNPNVNLVTFYISASDKTRLIRSLQREQNPDINEIIRRYQADKKDFRDDVLNNIRYIPTLNEFDRYTVCADYIWLYLKQNWLII